MRVVSMVPSWTETLLEVGVNVVGRTRFCLHPQTLLQDIPKVGGTKDWNLEKVRSLKPDLLILDREENPKMMAEQPDLPYWASHITGVESMPGALLELSGCLKNAPLEELARRWQAVIDAPCRQQGQDWPGVLEWGRRPTREDLQVVYVIWREPWMAVGPHTFIGSVLAKLGLRVMEFDGPYPSFDPSTLERDRTLLLFSSEPYPFLKKREGLAELGFPFAFVDGECFSWFGLRALRFLEEALFKDKLRR